MENVPAVSPPGDAIYLVLYGSHAHGTATETSDEDWRGVFIAATEDVFGIHPIKETYEQKPDVVMWELGKFANMLLKGNPNIVGLLNAPPDMIAYDSNPIKELFEHRERFVTRYMVNAYLGWMFGELQRERLTPKQLSHIPRLIWELEGALETGFIPVRPEGDRLKFIQDVKAGRADRAAVDELFREAEPRLRAMGANVGDGDPKWVNDVVVRARYLQRDRGWVKRFYHNNVSETFQVKR